MTLIQVFHRVGIIVAAALLVAAVGIKPGLAAAIPDQSMSDPAPPKQDNKKVHKKKVKKDKKDKDSAIEQHIRLLAQENFMRRYRAARELILAGDYNAGIAALHGIGHDEDPDVANYIGYANRKMGNYDESKYWYEKALAADPNHTRTWSYYGMWQMEQGNRLKAEDYLAKVKLLCGNIDCTEYKQLKDVIDGKASY
jgi:tetratricopeptide (TPR) repeat protein